MGERETLRTAKSLHRAEYRLYQKRLGGENARVHVAPRGGLEEGKEQDWDDGEGISPIKTMV